jgi:hypothetical protein
MATASALTAEDSCPTYARLMHVGLLATKLPPSQFWPSSGAQTENRQIIYLSVVDEIGNLW